MKKLLLFSSIVVICFVSCSKDDDSDPAPTNNPPVVTVNSPCQFSCTIDGVNYSVMGDSLFSCLSVHNESSSGFPIKHSYVSVVSSNSNNLTYPVLSIAKSYIYTNTGSPDTTAVLNFYSPGNYSYALNYNDSRIAVAFSTDSIQTFTSNDPVLDQAVSNFHIDESIISYDPLLQEPFIKVKAIFNCRLFGTGGVVKTLTNGVAVFKVYPNM